MGPVAAGFGDDGAAELSQQLRDGDGDQPEDAGVFVAGPLEGGGHSEEDIGEQADRGPAVPGLPADDLPGVQAAPLPGDRHAVSHASVTGIKGRRTLVT